jgi:hypothetical protein
MPCPLTAKRRKETHQNVRPQRSQIRDGPVGRNAAAGIAFSRSRSTLELPEIRTEVRMYQEREERIPQILKTSGLTPTCN